MGANCGVDNPTLVSTTTGVTAEMANNQGKPFLYFINPMNVTGANVCVADCPATTVALSPAESRCIAGTVATVDNIAALTASGLCVPFQYASSPVVGRCLPSEPIPLSLFNNSNLPISDTIVRVDALTGSSTGTASLYAKDLFASWKLIACMAAAAIPVTYLWTVILQFFAGVFVWLTIIFSNVLSIAITVCLYLYYNNQKALEAAKSSGTFNSILANGTSLNIGSNSFSTLSLTGYLPINSSTRLGAEEVQYVFYAFIVFCVITALLLLITVALRSRINTAIRILKEASIIFAKMPTICTCS